LSGEILFEKLFLDPLARATIERLIARREENEAFAKGWGHAKKHEKDVQLSIEDAYLKGQERTATIIEPIVYDPLPPLPEGTTHALAWYGLLG